MSGPQDFSLRDRENRAFAPWTKHTPHSRSHHTAPAQTHTAQHSTAPAGKGPVCRDFATAPPPACAKAPAPRRFRVPDLTPSKSKRARSGTLQLCSVSKKAAGEGWLKRTGGNPGTPPSTPSGPVPRFPQTPLLPPRNGTPHRADDRGTCMHDGDHRGRCRGTPVGPRTARSHGHARIMANAASRPDLSRSVSRRDSAPRRAAETRPDVPSAVPARDTTKGRFRHESAP